MPRTDIEFEPNDELVNPSFADLIDNRDRYIVLWGGRNAGKSVFAARKLIKRCLSEDYFRYILIKKTHESIKDSQWQTIKDEAEAMGVDHLFKFKISPLEIVCVNGNKFIARGLDNVAKLKSIKDPTGAWYEEGNQITEEDFITVTTSIRSLKADYIQEIFSFNPEVEIGDYEDFWLWRKFFKGHAGKSFRDEVTISFEFRGQTTHFLRHYTSHHSTYHDNEYLAVDQVADLEELKQLNPYWYTIYTLGEWGNKDVGDRFWKGFSRPDHVRDNVYINLDEPLHISFDENVNPYPALTIWQMEYTQENVEVRQIHEICLRNPNNKVEKVAQAFRKWATVNGWSSKVFIYGDASSAREDTKLERGVNYFTILRDRIQERFSVTIRKPSKNPPVAMSGEFINSIYDSNYGGISIVISSACKESINDYLLVQEKTDGTMKKPKDKHGVELLSHISDSKRYFLCQAFAEEFRRYQSKGADPSHKREFATREKKGW